MVERMSADTSTVVPSDVEERPGAHWRVWGCVESLLADSDANPMMADAYRETTRQVADIIRRWGYEWAGDLTWASFLNKRTLHHEAEESIVALHHLREWMQSRPNETPVIAVDVCGGKGFFSMLLSYMVSDYWEPQEYGCHLNKIVLLEKATPNDIDWMHIHAANARATPNPIIEIWSDCNLHQYDKLLTKFRALASENNASLALTGIHLCKMLSPSLVSLANGLGCPYLLLAPCCLPRRVLHAASKKVLTIPIHLHETAQEHGLRVDHNLRKLLARNNHACFFCRQKGHWVRDCPDLRRRDSTERERVLEAALRATPCWHCGTIGHFRDHCPTPDPRKKITTRHPPTLEMDISNVMASSTPFEDYCAVLAKHIRIEDEDGSSRTLCHPVTTESIDSPVLLTSVITLQKASNVQIVEAGLTGNKSGHDGNWNSRRKSIFLIASK